MTVAIILGGARDALRDLEAARAMAPAASLVALNDTLRISPIKPVAFATLHSEKAGGFLGGCDISGVRLFAHAPAAGWNFELVQERFGGSSGLYATLIALKQLRFAGVILAGVPMEEGARHIVSAGDWSVEHVERYQRGWLKAADAMKLRLRVRSMSGWTREQFGEPCAAWLHAMSCADPVAHSLA